ncbi:hypothetical protein ACHAPO_011294 [Fusarium lateritium]
MSRRLAFVFLSGLVASAAASQDVERQDVFCTTYLSTYLVAVSATNTVSAPADVGNSASEISDTALAEYTSTGSASDLIPDFSTVTKDDNQGTTDLPTSSVTISPTLPGGNSRPVIFRIIPDTSNNRRGLARRDLGGFVGSTEEVCAEASVFNLSNGRLLQGTAPVFYAGESFKELRGQAGSLPQNAITTAFVEVSGSLRFRNSALPNGKAGFCQTPENGQTYVTFTSSPPGCLAVRLSIVEAEDCEDEVSSASTTLTNGASQSLPGVETSSVDFAQTRSDSSPDFTQQLPTGVTQPSEVSSTMNFPTLNPSSDWFINTMSTRTRSFHFSNTSVSIEPPTAAQSEPSVNPSLPVELSSTNFFPSLPVTSETAQQSIDPSTTIDSFPTIIHSSLSQATSEETSSEASVTEITTSLETGLETSTILSDSTTVIQSEVPSTTIQDSISTFSVESTSFDVSSESSTIETTTTTAAPTRACSDYFIFEPTTLFSGDQAWENEVKSIDLPWPVGIYTDSSNKINVGVNGLITLFDDAATADENEELPSNSISSVAVCPFWDDLRIEPNAGHDITYQIVDDPDFRAVSVEWCGLDSDDVLTHFVVRFQEYTLSNPASIFMRYFTSNGGRSTTIGVQDGNVNKFLQYSFNQENAVPDGSTVLFFTLGGDERTVYVGP